MVALSIKTNFPQVQAALAKLHADIRDKALASAINKTLEQSKTAMGRAIVAEYNVTSAYVRERLRIRRAAARGVVRIQGSLIGGKAGAKRSANVVAFLEKKTTFAQAKKRRKAGTLDQLYFKFKRTGGTKPIAGAFIGNKGRTVFERFGPGRLQIKPVQTIDVGQMFNTKRINAVIVKTMQDKLPAIFEHEVAFYFYRFNQGRSGATK